MRKRAEDRQFKSAYEAPHAQGVPPERGDQAAGRSSARSNPRCLVARR